MLSASLQDTPEKIVQKQSLSPKKVVCLNVRFFFLVLYYTILYYI